MSSMRIRKESPLRPELAHWSEKQSPRGHFRPCSGDSSEGSLFDECQSIHYCIRETAPKGALFQCRSFNQLSMFSSTKSQANEVEEMTLHISPQSTGTNGTYCHTARIYRMTGSCKNVRLRVQNFCWQDKACNKHKFA